MEFGKGFPGAAAAGDESRTVARLHHDQLRESHLALQKIATKFAIPIATLAFAVMLLLQPCWQNAVLLGGWVLMSLAWFLALGLTRRGELERSVAVFIAAVIGFETLSMLVLGFNSATALLACTIMIIYASLFSRLFLYLASALTFAGLLAKHLVSWYRPWEFKPSTFQEQTVFEIGFVALLLPLAAIVLRRSHLIKDALVSQMTRMNEEQQQIIATATDVNCVLEEVVTHLKEFSTAFAAQAAEQAAAIAETNTVMLQIRDIAANTAGSAAETEKFAERTREKSVATARQLKSVEKGFDGVVGGNEAARAEFSDLASQAESIENVLRSNSDIAARIKILAINAGIQAAKAGEYGTGFNVVARELKEMIQNTDKSLGYSRELLESIRQRARHSADTIRTTSQLLSNHSGELSSTGRDLAEITETFVATAKQFRAISASAREQQARLDEVGHGIGQIDVAAAELTRQAQALMASVDKIAMSQASLRDILAARGDRAANEQIGQASGA
jgi:methyl-accepting chemotaxis protein